MTVTQYPVRRIRWVGDSRKRLQMRGIDSGVFEIICNDASNTYRAVYSIKIGRALYVLHTFQKKSKRGTATPRAELDSIRKRLRWAKEIAESEGQDG